MLFEIKHRFTGAVLFKLERGSLKLCVEAAISARADLAGADLAGAYLAGAYLAGANLAGADLAGANLAGANLAGAYLAGANLAGADLAGAYLAGANLAGANLAGADLAGANLAGADLAGANLAGADLAGADLADAYLADAKGVDPFQPAVTREEWLAQRATSAAERAARYREQHPEVPVVEKLDSAILAAIENGGALQMNSWHECETTHCRAGWAITLAGEAGKALEREMGPARAGAAIYRASTGRVPHFYASDAAALADIKACAAAEQAA